MTPDQIELVQRSFVALAPLDRQAGELFHQRLIEIDPETRAFFRGDRQLQSRKLMQVMAFLVSNLRAPEVLLPALLALGQRHAGYAVGLRQYGSIEQALLEALAATLGDAWTSDYAAAWTAAYAMVAEPMMAAQRAASEAAASSLEAA